MELLMRYPYIEQEIELLTYNADDNTIIIKTKSKFVYIDESGFEEYGFKSEGE